MKFRNNVYIVFSLMLLAITLGSCEKESISFGESLLADDPDITYLNNYKVDIASFKLDSFATSSNEILSIGYHTDPVFGVVKAGAYAQLGLPAENPLLNQNLVVIFDSLEIIVRSSGAFYGDSTRAVKIQVHRLTKNIAEAANTDIYYNTSSFAYQSAPIGEQVVNFSGKAGVDMHIRLSDALGQELLTKFKDNNVDISTSEKFTDYFKGIYISTDSVVTNSIAYLDAPADSVLVRLNYHNNGLFPEKKYIDFNYVTEKKFNSLKIRNTSANFNAFTHTNGLPVSSTLSGNQSFLNTNMGTYVKISFPGILNIKELHPYIKILRAELEIKPDASSFKYPYKLPATLGLYTTDETNYPGSAVYSLVNSQEAQNGNLYLDELYGQNTRYTYDITSFINTLISEGRFSKSALLLYQTVSDLDGAVQRLILNDQNGSNPSIQLKLYVLGL